MNALSLINGNDKKWLRAPGGWCALQKKKLLVKKRAKA